MTPENQKRFSSIRDDANDIIVAFWHAAGCPAASKPIPGPLGEAEKKIKEALEIYRQFLEEKG